MKSYVFTKIVSTLMAFAVVMASFSLKIEKKYCHSNLIEVSVISATTSCCYVLAKDGQLKLAKKPCCSSLSLVVEGFNNYQLLFSTSLYSLSTIEIVQSIQLPVEFIFETTVKHYYSIYNPPPLIADIQVWNQIFLI
jgi:hypothetical protein